MCLDTPKSKILKLKHYIVVYMNAVIHFLKWLILQMHRLGKYCNSEWDIKGKSQVEGSNPGCNLGLIIMSNIET